MLEHEMGQLCVTGLARNLNIFHHADSSDTNLQMVLLAAPRYTDQDLKGYLEFHISTLTLKERRLQEPVFKSNIISALAELFAFNMFDYKTTHIFSFTKLNNWRRYQTTIMREFIRHAVDVFSFLSASYKLLPDLERWNGSQNDDIGKAFLEAHRINHNFLSTDFLAILDDAYKAHLAHHFDAYLNSTLQSDEWNTCYKEYADYVMAEVEAWLSRTNQQGADYPRLREKLMARLSHMLYGDYVENGLMRHFPKGSKHPLLCVSFLKDLDMTVGDTEKGAIEVLSLVHPFITHNLNDSNKSISTDALNLLVRYLRQLFDGDQDSAATACLRIATELILHRSSTLAVAQQLYNERIKDGVYGTRTEGYFSTYIANNVPIVPETDPPNYILQLLLTRYLLGHARKSKKVQPFPEAPASVPNPERLKAAFDLLDQSSYNLLAEEANKFQLFARWSMEALISVSNRDIIASTYLGQGSISSLYSTIVSIIREHKPDYVPWITLDHPKAGKQILDLQDASAFTVQVAASQMALDITTEATTAMQSIVQMITDTFGIDGHLSAQAGASLQQLLVALADMSDRRSARFQGQSFASADQNTHLLRLANHYHVDVPNAFLDEKDLERVSLPITTKELNDMVQERLPTVQAIARADKAQARKMEKRQKKKNDGDDDEYSDVSRKRQKK
ncbi:hypothetical protein BDZ97DRAFT_1932236 [Flammula alnicola]|nr:hypothetical protein BDZ97DRAFT_1932236 [Flammula alnicola]